MQFKIRSTGALKGTNHAISPAGVSKKRALRE